MSTQGRDWWQAVSPYLDQALEMTDAERVAWLASLREQNRDLAAQLETLLEEHRLLVQQRFLEPGPAVPLPVQPALAGQTIGAYTVLSPIGEGGMGSVWLAERSDGRFERRAAVKLLNIALLGRGGERFKREGNFLARLAHPHIAQLLDAGVSPAGQPYLVLEYVDGEPIDEYSDRRTLDVEARIQLFLDVLGAVAHAHANLIVHRDLKPSNVLVRNDGQVKLLDFGIAKLLENEEQAGPSTVLTQETGGALTPAYAAPEQLTGESVTTATDVYALGVLLYVLLTGQHPAGSGARSTAELVTAIVETEPPRMSDGVTSSRVESAIIRTNATNRGGTSDHLQRVLRGDLDTIVAKSLKKNPQQRYASVIALADDLRRYLSHEPVHARPDTLAYRARKFVRRNRTAVALAALAFVVLVAGVAGTLIQARTARTQRDFAVRELSRAEALNDLNLFVLSDAAPSGKPFTVNDLLARAEHILKRKRIGDETESVEVFISVGDQYHMLGKNAKAVQVLDEAYQLSRGLADRPVRARASCALASALAYVGEMRRAEELFVEGLGELPSDPLVALDRSFCLLRGSEVARERGSFLEGLARVQAAQRLLKQSPVHPESLELDALTELAEAYRVAGRQREAITAFERASAQLAAFGRDDTETAAFVFNNWALALADLGRPREAEPIFRHAIEISRADTTDQAVSPIILRNYASTLRNLGRFDEAARYAERAYSRAQQEGAETVVDTALLVRSRIYRGQGNLPRAEAMLSEVEPRLRRDFPAGHYVFAVLDVERALLAQARGDLPTALGGINQAITFLEGAAKTGQRGSNLLPTLLVYRSDINLRLHRADDAAADASRALTLLRQAAQPGTFSGGLGHAYLALGHALQTQGKHDEARITFRSAAEHLESALGPDHPDTRAARQLAGLGAH